MANAFLRIVVTACLTGARSAEYLEELEDLGLQWDRAQEAQRIGTLHYRTIRKASVDGTLSRYDGVFGGYFAHFVSMGRYLSIVPRPSNQKRPRGARRYR